MQWEDLEDDAKDKAKKMGIKYSLLNDDEKANFLFYLSFQPVNAT